MGKKSKRPMKAHIESYKGTLDTILSARNLCRKSIAKDGSCLFRAVAEQVYLTQSYHHKLRLQCVEYIRMHPDDFKAFITCDFEVYLDRLSKELWGGEVELVVVSKLFNRSVVVYNELQGGTVQVQVFPSAEEDDKNISVDDLHNPILLAYSDGNHYDSVYTIKHMSNIAHCQGIVYRLLYQSVLGDKIPHSCHTRLNRIQEHEVTRDKQDVVDRPLHLLEVHYSSESIMAMGSGTYHNAALEAHKKEKESIELRDRRVAASIQFQVGDKCHFRLDELEGSDVIEGEIAELNVNSDCHLVYVSNGGTKEQWQIPRKNFTLKHTNGKRKFPAPTKPRGSAPLPSHGHGRPPLPSSSGAPSDPTKMTPSLTTQPSSSSSYVHKKQPSSDHQQQQATTRTAWGPSTPATVSKGREEIKKSVEQHGSGKQGVRNGVQGTNSGAVTTSLTRGKSDSKTQPMSRGTKPSNPPTVSPNPSATIKRMSPIPPVNTSHSKQQSTTMEPRILQAATHHRQMRTSAQPSQQQQHSTKPPGGLTSNVVKKTSSRLGGSLTSDDSSYSSSDESGGNGTKNHQSSGGTGPTGHPPVALSGSTNTTKWDGKHLSLMHQKSLKDKVKVDPKKTNVPPTVMTDKGVTVKVKESNTTAVHVQVNQGDVNAASKSNALSQASKKGGQKTALSQNVSKQRNAHTLINAHPDNALTTIIPQQSNRQRHRSEEDYSEVDNTAPSDEIRNGRTSPYWEGRRLSELNSQPGDAWPQIDDLPPTAPIISNTMLYKAASMGQQQQQFTHNAVDQIPVSGDKPLSPSNIMSSTAKSTMDYSSLDPMSSILASISSGVPPPIVGKNLQSSVAQVPPTVVNGPHTFGGGYLQGMNPTIPVSPPPGVVTHAPLPQQDSLFDVLGTSAKNNISIRHSVHQQFDIQPASYLKSSPNDNQSLSRSSEYTQTVPMAKPTSVNTSMGPITSRHSGPVTSKAEIPTSPPPASVTTTIPAPSAKKKKFDEIPEKLLINAYTQTFSKKRSIGSQATYDVAITGTQTDPPSITDHFTQTEGLYVALDELCPPQVNEDTDLSKLHFALQYSIQCLSVYAQLGDEDVQSLVNDLKRMEEEGVKDLLMKTLVDPQELNASQQDFLQSFTTEEHTKKQAADVNGQIVHGVNDVPPFQQVLATNSSDVNLVSEQTISEDRKTVTMSDQTLMVDSDGSSQQAQPHPQLPPMYPPQMMMPRPHPMMMLPSPFYPPTFMPPYPMPSYYPIPPHPFGHPMVPQMSATSPTPNYNQSTDEVEQQQEEGEVSKDHNGEGPSHNESSESEQETAAAGKEDENFEIKQLVPGFENPLPPSVLPNVIMNPTNETINDASSIQNEETPSASDVVAVETQVPLIDGASETKDTPTSPPLSTDERQFKSDDSAKDTFITQESNSVPVINGVSENPGLPCRPGPSSGLRKSNQTRQDRRYYHNDRNGPRNKWSKSRQSNSYSTSKSSRVSSPPPNKQQQQQQQQQQKRQRQQTTVQQTSDHEVATSKEQISASSESSQPTHKSRHEYKSKGGASKTSDGGTSGPINTSKISQSQGGGASTVTKTVDGGTSRQLNTSKRSQLQRGGTNTGSKTGDGGTSGQLNTSKRSQSQEGGAKATGNARSFSANRKNSKRTSTSSSATTGTSERNSKDATRNLFTDFYGSTFLDEPVIVGAPCTSYRSFCGAFTSMLGDSNTSRADTHHHDHLTTLPCTTSSQAVNVVTPIPCASGSTSVMNHPSPLHHPSVKFDSVSHHPQKHSEVPELVSMMSRKFNDCGPLDVVNQQPVTTGELFYVDVPGANNSICSNSSSFEGSFHDELENDFWDSDVGDCLSYTSSSDEAQNLNELRMVVPVSSVPCHEVPSQLVHGQRYVNPYSHYQ